MLRRESTSSVSFADTFHIWGRLHNEQPLSGKRQGLILIMIKELLICRRIFGWMFFRRLLL